MLPKLAKKRIWSYLAFLCAVLFAFMYGMLAGAYHLPPYAWVRDIKHLLQPSMQASPIPNPFVLEPSQAEPVARIIALLEQEAPSSQTTRIDTVREFVYQNSVHQIDQQFEQYGLDYPHVLKLLYEHSQQGGSPPHMDCSTRSVAMNLILQGMGIQSRGVHVFSDNFETLKSHTFLEVYNPDTGHWEAQDPDYDVYYVHQETLRRLSALELILGDLDQIEPKSTSVEQIQTVQRTIIPDYFELLVYQNVDGSMMLGIVNTQRFKLPEMDAVFKDYAQKHYGRLPLLTIQGFGE